MKYQIKPLKGFRSVVAYNAYTALMLNISLSPTALGLISVEDGEGHAKKQQSMFDVLRSMPNSDKRKKHIFLELVKISDLDSAEYLKLFQICADSNGIEISDFNVDNYSMQELQNMLYDAWCACLAHGTEVFF